MPRTDPTPDSPLDRVLITCEGQCRGWTWHKRFEFAVPVITIAGTPAPSDAVIAALRREAGVAAAAVAPAKYVCEACSTSRRYGV